MRNSLVLGLGLAILAATCAAQDETVPKVKHFQDRTNSHKGGAVVVKKPAATTPEATLRRLEQQGTKVAVPQRAKRAPANASLLKTEKEKSAPPIRVAGLGNGAKGTGTTTQGANPYRGRLRQKGSHH